MRRCPVEGGGCMSSRVMRSSRRSICIDKRPSYLAERPEWLIISWVSDEMKVYFFTNCLTHLLPVGNIQFSLLLLLINMKDIPLAPSSTQ